MGLHPMGGAIGQGTAAVALGTQAWWKIE
ncbi:MAG: hypothetical protein ACI8XO_000641 [Verrucomicrobiales bacterium]